MKIPTTLKHKPVITVENYEQVDGHKAYQSDAKGLSLGLAQWNDRGKVDISAKVWRHTGEKWSRQSEELPLHRVLDLAILACRAQLYFQEEASRFPRGSDPEHPACISADGSVIRRSRAFREALDGFIDSFIEKDLGRSVVIWSTENATMLGSAAAALLNG